MESELIKFRLNSMLQKHLGPTRIQIGYREKCQKLTSLCVRIQLRIQLRTQLQ